MNKNKEMKIIFEKNQCSVRIPQKYRKILKLKKKDKIIWSIDTEKKELFGYISK